MDGVLEAGQGELGRPGGSRGARGAVSLRIVGPLEFSISLRHCQVSGGAFCSQDRSQQTPAFIWRLQLGWFWGG